MKTENVEQIIRELFRLNYNSNPESYPAPADGLFSEEGDDNAEQWSIDLWNNRTESEIERDEELCISIKEYQDWVKQEFYKLQSAQI